MNDAVPPAPVWLWDPENRRIVDANAPALAFWDALSRTELAGRDFVAADPMVRGLEALWRAAGARTAEAVLDVAPSGAAVRIGVEGVRRGARLRIRHLPKGHGAIGGVEAEKARLEAAFSAARDAMWIVGGDGAIQFQSAAAGATFETAQAASFDASFVEPERAAEARATARLRGALTIAAEMRTRFGRRRRHVGFERLDLAAAVAGDDGVLLAIARPVEEGGVVVGADQAPIGWARYALDDLAILAANHRFRESFPDARRLSDVAPPGDAASARSIADRVFATAEPQRLSTRAPDFGDALLASAVFDGVAVGELWQAPSSEPVAIVDPSPRDDGVLRAGLIAEFAHAAGGRLQNVSLSIELAKLATDGETGGHLSTAQDQLEAFVAQLHAFLNTIQN